MLGRVVRTDRRCFREEGLGQLVGTGSLDLDLDGGVRWDGGGGGGAYAGGRVGTHPPQTTAPRRGDKGHAGTDQDQRVPDRSAFFSRSSLKAAASSSDET